jgi:hypothetical protein
MNLEELTPAPSAKKVNDLAKRVFGYALDLDNLTENKAKRLHKNLTAQMNIYESSMGAKAQSRTRYYEMKLALEALTKHIAEKEAKPDFLDLDKDGNKTEPMKKAAKDAKKKTGESVIKEKDAHKMARMDNLSQALKDMYRNDPKRFFKTIATVGFKAKPLHKALGDEIPMPQQTGGRKGEFGESIIKEGAVEASELVMAAKSMVDKYDAMIQDVGEMLNEELQPVADKIRDEMGSDIADQFVAQMTQALQSTMDVMKSDRMTADGATRILTGDAPAGDMGMDADMDDVADMEPTMDMDDEFDAAPAAQGGEEAPVGREKRA